MIKYFISLSVILYVFFSQAVMASELENQEYCVQQTVAACVNQCEKTDDIVCSQACEENAQNQCIQAGE